MMADAPGVAPASGTEGFLTHIRQLGVSVLEHIAMRAELLSLEVREEKTRLVRLAICVLLVSALLIISLVLAAILVLAIYWDTSNRVPAALSLVGAFIVLTAGGGFYLASQLRRSTALFTTSASELRRDAELLSPQQPSL